MTPEQLSIFQRITDIIATKRANKTAQYICVYISDLKCCDKKVINELIQLKKIRWGNTINDIYFEKL